MRYVNYHSYQSVENVLVYRYPAINTYLKYHFRCGNIYVTLYKVVVMQLD